MNPGEATASCSPPGTRPARGTGSFFKSAVFLEATAADGQVPLLLVLSNWGMIQIRLWIKNININTLDIC